MKAAVIGAGNVGKAVFHDLQHVRMISELTLIGRDIDKVRAEVMDARDAAVLRGENGPRLFYGGYSAAEGADLLICTAGAAKLKGERMSVLRENTVITEEIFTEISRYNRDPIVICATNPLDVIVMKILRTTGWDPGRVIGSGTLLESGRLIRYLSELLDLSDRSVRVSVVGEHGPTAVALLSSVRIMGMTLDEYFRSVTASRTGFDRDRLTEAFKKEAYRIFLGKGYTSTGVSAAVCRIAGAIASDSREVFPVSSELQGEYGLSGVAVSVPSVIGKSGIEEITEAVMNAEEREAFLASAETVRQAAASVGII